MLNAIHIKAAADRRSPEFSTRRDGRQYEVTVNMTDRSTKYVVKLDGTMSGIPNVVKP